MSELREKKHAEYCRDASRYLNNMLHAVLKPDNPEFVYAECRVLDKAADLLEECERAFESLAALNDHGANDRLAATGSYGSFDEPGAVQVSREMLAKLRAQERADE